MSALPRMPVVYLPHGGGPWPFVELGFFDPTEQAALRRYLVDLPAGLRAAPRAIVSVSAHWEEPVATVSTAAVPGMLYDYTGFPPEAYTLTWPARGDPALAARIRGLLAQAGISSAEDPTRGYDHGTFVPLKVAWPEARVPTVQLSLVRGLDPAVHLAVGRALQALRDEGVLIVGSGMSYHDMRGFGTKAGLDASAAFDGWLRACVTTAPDARDDGLRRWAQAPAARACHPREEHLLPLMVVAGAAGDDRGRVAFAGRVLGAHVSAAHFG